MLEFIVLGHIPGTDIYLSFESVALITLTLISTYFLLKLAGMGWRAKIKQIQQRQTIVYLRTQLR